MIMTGTIESMPSKTSFGCIIGSDGKEYLFKSCYSNKEGEFVTFVPYLEYNKFLRAREIDNYIQVLERYYWIFVGKRENSEESQILDKKLELLNKNKIDIGKSRTAQIALQKLLHNNKVTK